jgi:hypothetical protein
MSHYHDPTQPHIISGNSSASFQQLLLKATIQLEHLLDQPGTVPAKLDYIRFKLLPIILHTAQCANWPLRIFRLLDKPFTIGFIKTEARQVKEQKITDCQIHNLSKVAISI